MCLVGRETLARVLLSCMVSTGICMKFLLVDTALISCGYYRLTRVVCMKQWKVLEVLLVARELSTCVNNVISADFTTHYCIYLSVCHSLLLCCVSFFCFSFSGF